MLSYYQTGTFAGFAWVMDKGLMKMQLNARSCARSGQSRIIVKEQL
jgi:hypothetical protein